MFIGVDLMKLEFFSTDFRKMFRFHENHTDGRTDMTKVIVAFRTFANASNNDYFF
jgi:hypothetical protein